MKPKADELLSEILDEGAEREIDPALQEAIAQRLFVHGLLLEHHDRASLDSLVSRAMGRGGASGRRIWTWTGSLAAALLFSVLAVVLLTGDSLPSAEAAVERLIRTHENLRDLHYAGRIYRGNGADSAAGLEMDLHLRGNKWVLVPKRPLAIVRVVGEGPKVWVVTPFQRVLEVSRTGGLLPPNLDPAMLGGNLLETLREMKGAFVLSPVSRETLRGKPVLRVHGTRKKEFPGGVKQADIWMEPESGRCVRAEFRFEHGVLAPRRLVLEYADSEPREDRLFALPGSSK